MGINEGADKVKGAWAEDWKRLRERVNALLSAAGINEDKHLGPFFLNSKELSDREYFISAVKSKVLMYLFEDAAKHKRSVVFADNLSYSGLVQAFENAYLAGDMTTAQDKIFLPTANQ